MSAKWKDATSYRQDEKAPRTPRSFELELPKATRLRVMVTSGHIYYPNTWVYRVVPFMSSVETCAINTEEGAKREAIERAFAFINTMARELTEATTDAK